MRKMLAIFACSVMLFVGPCTLDSWNLPIDLAVGGIRSFFGV